MHRYNPFAALPAALAGLILSASAAVAQAPVPTRDAAPSSPAPSADSIRPAEVADLQTRVRVLEERLQAQSAALAGAPRVEAGTGGFRVGAPDDAFVIRFRGYVQEDGRFFGADAPAGNGSFLLRRVRPILEGTVFRYYDFRVMTDFGEGKVSLQDAYADVRFVPWLRLRAGKFKPPVGLERLQSATSLAFIERGFVSSLAPNRDVGAQLWGELAGGAVSWAAGVFNGVPDGASADADSENGKDLAGRIFLEPFRRSGVAGLKGLGAGIAATRGTQSASPGAPFLASYRTPAQLSLFGYRSDGTPGGTAIADGLRTRVVPQGWWYAGPVGVLGEYAVSSQRVALDEARATLRNRAWNLSAGVVLTGESASYAGVRPRRDLDPATGGWGALELVGRLQALELDDGAFPTFADPARSPLAAHARGAGVNWYLDRNLKLSADYERTSFHGGRSGGDRPAEGVLLTRLQLAF
jgi:phosphate-selective porin OprO/OprP